MISLANFLGGLSPFNYPYRYVYYYDLTTLSVLFIEALASCN